MTDVALKPEEIAAFEALNSVIKKRFGDEHFMAGENQNPPCFHCDCRDYAYWIEGMFYAHERTIRELPK